MSSLVSVAGVRPRDMMVGVLSRQPGGSHRLPAVVGFVLLLLRGVLLWVIVPIGLVVWMIVGGSLRRRGVGCGQFLSWLDLNLIAMIERTVLRPLVRAPFPWTPAADLPRVTHRIRAAHLV